jgi:hypothetical protein
MLMSHSEIVASLKAQHAELERELNEENSRPMPDAAHVAELKREKLRLKDEMSRLETAH